MSALAVAMVFLAAAAAVATVAQVVIGLRELRRHRQAVDLVIAHNVAEFRRQKLDRIERP